MNIIFVYLKEGLKPVSRFPQNLAEILDVFLVFEF